MKKPGPTPKSEDQLRKHTVTLRFTESEFQKIKNAQPAQFSKAIWLREKVLALCTDSEAKEEFSTLSPNQMLKLATRQIQTTEALQEIILESKTAALEQKKSNAENWQRVKEILKNHTSHLKKITGEVSELLETFKTPPD